MKEQTPKGIRRYLSTAFLREKVGQACRRFPGAAFFAALTAVLSIVNITDDLNEMVINSRILEHLILSSSFGYLITVAAVLWSEFLNRKSTWFQIAGAVVAVLMFIVWETAKYNYDSLFVGTIAVFTAAAAMLFFVPCFKRPSLRLSHSHTDRVLANAIISGAVGWAMSIFIMILWGTVSVLFRVSSFDFFQVLLVILGALLPMTVFLCRMPSVGDESGVPGFSAPLAKNIFLIPALIYMAVLYVYGIKILVEWELPKAPIVWMVTGIVVVVFLIIFGLQGYIADSGVKETNEKIARLTLRWLPVALLPLLVLMSVAIFYRIGQYGVTSSRLYVATFNIWAYGAILYLIFSRKAELSNLATTFTGIFIAVSVIPGFNYCSVDAADKNGDDFTDDDMVEVVETKCFEQSAGPLKISEIPQAYNTIEYLSKTDYRTSKQNAVREITLRKGIDISGPLDSVVAIPESSFTPCLLSVKGCGDKAYLLTKCTIWLPHIVDSDKTVEYDNVSVEGYLLSK